MSSNQKIQRVSIIWVITLAFTLLLPVATHALSQLKAGTPVGGPRRIEPATYSMQTTTDSNGNFDVPHGLAAGTRILGVIVSVRNTSNNWYTVYATSQGSRVAWNDTNVSAIFLGSEFRNQPVRILLFATQ
jgi:hypothetical protein